MKKVNESDQSQNRRRNFPCPIFSTQIWIKKPLDQSNRVVILLPKDTTLNISALRFLFSLRDGEGDTMTNREQGSFFGNGYGNGYGKHGIWGETNTTNYLYIRARKILRGTGDRGHDWEIRNGARACVCVAATFRGLLF